MALHAGLVNKAQPMAPLTLSDHAKITERKVGRKGRKSREEK